MNTCQVTYKISLKPITFCKWRLVIGRKEMYLSFSQLLQLRSELNRLTSPSNLIDIIDNDNFVLLFIADKEHLVYLEIAQLLDLKALISYVFE